jgi:hypothetical protein
MKTVITHTLKLACVAALIACAHSVTSAQQTLVQPASRLQIDTLDALAPKANRVVDVTLDENLLKLIPAIIMKANHSANDPDARKAAQIAAGFKGVYVRSFEFDGDGQWNEADIAGIRAQLRQPGWSRIVSVRSRKDGQNVEVYLMTDPSNFGGLAVLATQPNELTVVNIVGKINLEDLLALEGHLGIPDLDIQIGGDTDRDDKKVEPKRNPPATKKP